MNWVVEYARGVRQEAVELWAISPDPKAAREALAEIAARLAADPEEAGRHLSEGLWMVVVRPYVAWYVIDHERRHVEITDIITTP